MSTRHYTAHLLGNSREPPDLSCEVLDWFDQQLGTVGVAEYTISGPFWYDEGYFEWVAGAVEEEAHDYESQTA